ncbi:acetyl-CoA-acetyltransferase [Penicillium cf. viridicatum]|uniref:acetyl-CoA C-acetyltransferase n=1 Tax=Penicillium cf. viridicatum TaxID=2972119 RepID=A0A9W9N5T6_9EURO|nr:acetyl-CoA-acetyltransferase [Penicillium cf. viridicatum]
MPSNTSGLINTSSTATERLTQVGNHLTTTAREPKEILDVYILSAARTPTTRFGGSFANVPAPQLGAYAITEALIKSKLPFTRITGVYMGNVLQGSVGQSPARQAAILAGLPVTAEAVTINKVCASGLKAVVMAAQNIQLGLSEAQNPRFSPPGDIKLEDGLIKDGLWDVYNQVHMGSCAENTAKKLNISREAQDKYAIRSFLRAQKAWAEGKFKDEVVPVTVKGKSGDIVVSQDEGFERLNVDKVPKLKPSFTKKSTGTVTAANSSPLNDGASALVLVNKALARESFLTADAAVDPIDVSIAPATAVPIALERAGIRKEDVAVWEFNEAFAVVIKANEKILGLENANMNPLGGAISLGHALGSSGSRILTTLLHQLKVGEYGVAAVCNGGGAATAIVVQRVKSVY